jgi:hypothetical protein
MKMPSAIRAALLALTAFAGAALSSASHADEGSVSLVIYKAGWIIGGSGGGGTLNFRLRPRVRRIEDGAARPGQQHQPAVGRGRRLWRGGRGTCGRQRRARDRADQPEGRGAGIVRPAGRADGECGFEWAGDYVEVAGWALGRGLRGGLGDLSPRSLKSGGGRRNGVGEGADHCSLFHCAVQQMDLQLLRELWLLTA